MTTLIRPMECADGGGWLLLRYECDPAPVDRAAPRLIGATGRRYPSLHIAAAVGVAIGHALVHLRHTDRLLSL